MAEKLCSLKKSGSSGGGGSQGTLLWQNSGTTAPSSPIQLSDSLANYTKIRIDFLYESTDSDTSTLIMPIANLGAGPTPLYNQMRGVARYSSSQVPFRVYGINSANATQLHMYTSNNNLYIPMAIYGIA